MSQCSLIAKARNEIVERFLASGFENLFFLDTDMQWDITDFMTVLTCEKDVVGGSYRRKEKRVSFTFVPVSPMNEEGDFIEAECVGTGFLRIKRSVFEKMQAPLFQNIRAYFNLRIENGQYLGEDYAFCKDWKAQGGTVWVYPCTLKHWGQFAWEGTQ